MEYRLKKTNVKELAKVQLPSSKSISNRLLIAKAIGKGQVKIESLSTANDTLILKQALNSNSNNIDVGMAGTAFRFLTAYLATQEGSHILTGDARMKKRPIEVLVDILRELGADIEYLENEGFPPLRIMGKQLSGGGSISIDGSVSSQYISAMLLIAPSLQGGLEIEMVNKIVSLPYIDLSIALQAQLGIQVERDKTKIIVAEGVYSSKESILVEKDWSSAAFFYQSVALGKEEVLLENLGLVSIQGDVACAKIFEKFGVKSELRKDGIFLQRSDLPKSNYLEFDLQDTPDLIPSVIVTASQLIDKTLIKGTSTLLIKESNRVEVLKGELAKIGVVLNLIDPDTIEIFKSKSLIKNSSFNTYNDHRIAMCLAPLIFYSDSVSIEDPMVVDKSFPGFWREFSKLGVEYSY